LLSLRLHQGACYLSWPNFIYRKLNKSISLRNGSHSKVVSLASNSFGFVPKSRWLKLWRDVHRKLLEHELDQRTLFLYLSGDVDHSLAVLSICEDHFRLLLGTGWVKNGLFYCGPLFVFLWFSKTLKIRSIPSNNA